MRLVMHIGSHKAGSTSIQEYCRSAPAMLHAAGVHYPVSALPGHPGQHSALNRMVIENRMAEVGAFLTGAAAAARAQGAGTVLLSGEDLCVMGPGLAHRFHLAASRVFSETRVVLLLRNKRDYFYSAYKHHLLHGPAVSEESFVAGQVFSPRRTVAAWRQLKGVQVQVLSFDALKADLLGGFFRAALGIEVRARLMANRSLDYPSLLAVNALLKTEDGGAVDRQGLAEVLRLRAGQPPVPALPVEDVIADGLNQRFDAADWEVPGLDFTAALLERRVMAREVDLAAVSARMVELYSVLQTYFARRKQAV